MDLSTGAITSIVSTVARIVTAVVTTIGIVAMKDVTHVVARLMLVVMIMLWMLDFGMIVMHWMMHVVLLVMSVVMYRNVDNLHLLSVVVYRNMDGYTNGIVHNLQLRIYFQLRTRVIPTCSLNESSGAIRTSHPKIAIMQRS